MYPESINWAPPPKLTKRRHWLRAAQNGKAGRDKRHPQWSTAGAKPHFGGAWTWQDAQCVRAAGDDFTFDSAPAQVTCPNSSLALTNHFLPKHRSPSGIPANVQAAYSVGLFSSLLLLLHTYLVFYDLRVLLCPCNWPLQPRSLYLREGI